MMNSQLISELEAVGFPIIYANGRPIEPALEALIDVCWENFGTLSQHVERKLWEATSKVEKDRPAVRGLGNTPKEAVASMYVSIINGIRQ